MFHVRAEDFQDLKNFEYISYWTDPNVFPEQALEHIHVLQSAKAQELETYLMKPCQSLSLSLFQEIQEISVRETLFITIERLVIEKHSLEQVQSWLISQDISSETILYLSWNSATAVVVPWSIFCHYWDAFCFTGLDDICMSSVSGTWRLLYYHEGILLIGKMRNEEETNDSFKNEQR